MKISFSGILLICGLILTAQENNNHNSFVDINYFSGSIPLHNNSILQLITGHPNGFILGWNKKTIGTKPWEQRFNYPDYGVSVAYQDLNNEVLGHNFGLYAHYNFYFLKRHVVLRVGQGLAITNNPYDKIDNPKNIAFGSSVLSSTLLMLNYKRERVFHRFGMQAGLSFIHYSNANVKAPNTSINTLALNIGVTYNLSEDDTALLDYRSEDKFTEPIKYNLVFRSGINESDVIGSGQYPFFVFSAYADKRIGHISAIQLGADVFLSKFLEELIYFQSVSFPEENVSGDEDYRRVGVFIGHELFINRLSLITQLGYYVYYPFDFEGRTYSRVGLKHYFNNTWFATLSLKSHGAKAEAVELGLGIRL